MSYSTYTKCWSNGWVSQSAVGTCNTAGTAVTWVSGNNFVTSWPNGTQIYINGVSYTITSVTDTTHLVISSTAGTQSAVPFSAGTPIDAPELNTIETGIVNAYSNFNTHITSTDHDAHIATLTNLLWAGKALPTNAVGHLTNDGNGNLSFANTLTAPNSTQWNSKSMPSNALGYLKNDGSGNLSWYNSTIAYTTGFSTWQTGFTYNTVYQAAYDGILCMYTVAAANQNTGCLIKCDANSTPTLTFQTSGLQSGTSSICVPVMKGYYFSFNYTGVNSATGQYAMWFS